MQAKYTPGPWAPAELSPVEIVTAKDVMIATAREGLNGISREQAVANARLIAAAPELLAALRLLYDCSCNTMRGKQHYLDNARAEALAAIAKATSQE